MSFSKNPPPWSLSGNAAAPPSLQAQMGLPNPMVNFQTQPQPVFSQGLTITTPQAPPPPSISLITPPLNPLYTVSYPAPRPMNTIAYPQTPTHQLQQHPQMQPQQQQQQISPQAQQIMNPMPPGVGPLPTAVLSGPSGGVLPSIMATQRAYTGTVTKIQGDVGIIDDEIFFHKSVVCKGSMPKVGERVFVEASYAQNTPYKWNASRVQLLNTSNAATHGIAKPSYNSHENGSYHRSSTSRSTHHSSSHHSRSPPRRSLDRTTSKREISRDSDDHDRRRRPPPSRTDDRDKERRERRDYTPPIERRDKSPASRSSTSTRAAAASPPLKKKRRIAPRYLVRVPKFSLNLKQADLLALKQRYSTMYIPSDFFHSEIRWPDAFTPDNPFVLRQPCAFHFMHKEAMAPKELEIDETLFEPADADNTFTAKVMLMSVPPMKEIYKECLANADDDQATRMIRHPTRMISFLVGERGRSENVGIGGPWSPSLDGLNPQSDPTVLIRTAIRTCKALTGIDLSRCTQWHRFMELYYHRRETGRVHTVVVYLPDIRSCLPTLAEWQTLKEQYKVALEGVLDQNHNSSRNSSPTASNKGESEAKDAPAGGEGEVTAEKSNGAMKEKAESGVAESAETTNEAMETTEENKEKEGEEEGPTTVAAADAVEAEPEAGVVDKDDTAKSDESMETDENQAEAEEVPEIVDPKSMKMPELKKALLERNLPVKGLKADLVERLTEALKKEEVPIDEPTPVEAAKPVEEPVEESNQSTEDGEPDLANMVVIDECCDPAKQKTDESPKEKEKPAAVKVVKPLDEKEVRHLQRRYKIPESPQIIVHPSKTAKGGKFDCNLMKLAILLTYGQDDSKEHAFEVSLFAELFNEMLLRDAAYNIFKAIYDLPERKEEAKSPSKDNKEEKRDDREKKDKTNEKDKAEEEASSGEKKKQEKERKVQVTVDPELLLSFSFFDESNCGYIHCKDLEDIISSIGLSLSRGQIKKIVSKASSTDSLYYRKLTDKDKEDKEAVENDTKKISSSPAESAIIAKGNFNHWPIFKCQISESNGSLTTKTITSAKTTTIKVEGKNNEETGMVLHNGTLVNIEKLMERIKAAERALLDTEQVVADLKKENGDLVSVNSKSQSKIKDLTSDVNSVTKKLDSMAGLQRKNSEYLSALASINDKITPFLAKKEREKDREKERSVSHNAESRDREPKVKVKQETKSSRPPPAEDSAGTAATTTGVKKEK